MRYNVDVESNFINLAVHLSPTGLPPDLLKYLYTYLSAVFSLPLEPSEGTALTSDQVVRKLDEDTVSYNAQIGVAIDQTIEISLKFEKSKYSSMIGFLKDLLWSSKFDTERWVAGKNCMGDPRKSDTSVLAAFVSLQSKLFRIFHKASGMGNGLLLRCIESFSFRP